MSRAGKHDSRSLAPRDRSEMAGELGILEVEVNGCDDPTHDQTRRPRCYPDDCRLPTVDHQATVTSGDSESDHDNPRKLRRSKIVKGAAGVSAMKDDDEPSPSLNPQYFSSTVDVLLTHEYEDVWMISIFRTHIGHAVHGVSPARVSTVLCFTERFHLSLLYILGAFFR
ncbi:hypothetical protein BDZ97DRAFT_1763811 [Flammula alnicola]|nr:hypothetical protein BDZ97DRAFT_1763811 [Flammula alnicola]